MPFWVRQNTRVDGLFFKVTDIIKQLSLCATIPAGTVIMTGTPVRVAAFLDPPVWLENGDVVEVVISNIGAVRNKYAFAN